MIVFFLVAISARTHCLRKSALALSDDQGEGTHELKKTGKSCPLETGTSKELSTGTVNQEPIC